MERPKALSADQFCEPDDLQLEPYPLPESIYGPDAIVYLVPWDGMKRSAFEKAWGGKEPADDPARVRFDVIRRTVMNEEGKPLFAKGDFDRVMRKRASTLEGLFERCLELNAVRETDIEELVKNSESGRSSASSTGSAPAVSGSTQTTYAGP